MKNTLNLIPLSAVKPGMNWPYGAEGCWDHHLIGWLSNFKHIKQKQRFKNEEKLPLASPLKPMLWIQAQATLKTA